MGSLRQKRTARVAVVGAGLSGLTVGYRLFQANIDVTVYEARRRVGGRVLSVSIEDASGLRSVAELGAHNITDGGSAMHLSALIAEFALQTEDCLHTLSTWIYKDGAYISYQETLERFLKEHPDFLHTVSEQALHAVSMKQLIDQLFQKNPLLHFAFTQRMTAYEGVPVDEQAIYHNLETFLYMLKGGLAPAHEAYEHAPHQILVSKIIGGNARLPIAMAKVLGDRLLLGTSIKGMNLQEEGIELMAEGGVPLQYDYVVLAVPIATYAQLQFQGVAQEPERLAQQQQTAYGQNHKVLIPRRPDHATERHLILDGAVYFFSPGDTFTTLYLNHAIQDKMRLKHLYGGALGFKDAVFQDLQDAVDQHFVDYQTPVQHNWGLDPFARCSYSGYGTKLGADLDTLVSYRGESIKSLFAPMGRLLFCGEHTTILDCVGTMEAAVESGERLARLLRRVLAGV